MLPQSKQDTLWLREQDHAAINLHRWQQQVELLSNFYRSDISAILQVNNSNFQVVSSQQSQDFGLKGGLIFLDENLLAMIESHNGVGLITTTGASLSGQLSQFKQILVEVIFWPDGELFGCLVICNPNQQKFRDKLRPLVETTRSLVQSELKQLFLMNQVKMLSVQDEHTCMLNKYGFSLMAPRQLSLSRRFGSHAGIVMVEAIFDSPNKANSETKLRLLARIIHNNLRDADVSARISENQFIILCFIDNESNLDALVLRLKKQFAKEAKAVKVITGQSYFAPDIQISLDPMQNQARESLNLSRLELQNNHKPQ